MSRILIATDLPFWRADRGDRARIAALARAIHDAGHEVGVFAALAVDEGDRAAIDALLPGAFLAPWADLSGEASEIASPGVNCESRLASTLAPPSLLDFAKRESVRQRLGHAARAVLPAAALDSIRALRMPPSFAGEPSLADFDCPETAAAFRKACAGWQPDAVIVEYIRLAYLIRDLPPGPRLYLDTLDVMHVRAARFHAFGQPHWLAITREEEAAACAAFDGLIAIQETDADLLRCLCPDKPVVVAGHAPPLPPPTPLPHAPPVSVLYLATDALPNQAALQWFVRAVWKPIHRRYPDARLRVAGAIANRIPDGAEAFGIDAIGPVHDDLAAVYRHAHIVINPVFFGGGLKIKTVEALAAGRPILTTPEGVEGMRGPVREAAVVANGARAWRRALTRLIVHSALRESLSQRAHAYAEHWLRSEVSYSDLVSLLAPESKK